MTVLNPSFVPAAEPGISQQLRQLCGKVWENFSTEVRSENETQLLKSAKKRNFETVEQLSSLAIKVDNNKVVPYNFSDDKDCKKFLRGLLNYYLALAHDQAIFGQVREKEGFVFVKEQIALIESSLNDVEYWTYLKAKLLQAQYLKDKADSYAKTASTWLKLSATILPFILLLSLATQGFVDYLTAGYFPYLLGSYGALAILGVVSLFLAIFYERKAERIFSATHISYKNNNYQPFVADPILNWICGISAFFAAIFIAFPNVIAGIGPVLALLSVLSFLTKFQTGFLAARIIAGIALISAATLFVVIPLVTGHALVYGIGANLNLLMQASVLNTALIYTLGVSLAISGILTIVYAIKDILIYQHRNAEPNRNVDDLRYQDDRDYMHFLTKLDISHIELPQKKSVADTQVVAATKSLIENNAKEQKAEDAKPAVVVTESLQSVLKNFNKPKAPDDSSVIMPQINYPSFTHAKRREVK